MQGSGKETTVSCHTSIGCPNPITGNFRHGDAVTAWNTRANLTPDTWLIDRLKSEYEHQLALKCWDEPWFNGFDAAVQIVRHHQGNSTPQSNVKDGPPWDLLESGTYHWDAERRRLYIAGKPGDKCTATISIGHPSPDRGDWNAEGEALAWWPAVLQLLGETNYGGLHQTRYCDLSAFLKSFLARIGHFREPAKKARGEDSDVSEAAVALLAAYDFATKYKRPLTAIRPNVDILREVLSSEIRDTAALSLLTNGDSASLRSGGELATESPEGEAGKLGRNLCQPSPATDQRVQSQLRKKALTNQRVEHADVKASYAASPQQPDEEVFEGVVAVLEGGGKYGQAPRLQAHAILTYLDQCGRLKSPERETAQPDESRDLDRRGLLIRLDTIARLIQNWIDWSKKQRDKEGLRTDDGTAIMSLPVPFWPGHGQLAAWVNTLRDAEAVLRQPEREFSKDDAQLALDLIREQLPSMPHLPGDPTGSLQALGHATAIMDALLLHFDVCRRKSTDE